MDKKRCTDDCSSEKVVVASQPPQKVFVTQRRDAAPHTMSANNEVLAKRYFQSPLYPAEKIWNMFSKVGEKSHDASSIREYAFFVEKKDSPGETCVIRHLVFKTANDFIRAIASLKPMRIDIGGMYLVPPKRDTPLSEVIAQETIFDIDIDKYDGDSTTLVPARRCCEGSRYCRSCWPLVNTAARIIDARLKSFGSDRNVIFFSGGRGLHIRVLSARDWTFYSCNRSIRKSLRKIIIPDPSRRLAERSMLDEDLLSAISMLVEIPGRKERPHDGGFLGWYLDKQPDLALTALLYHSNEMMMELDRFKDSRNASNSRRDEMFKFRDEMFKATKVAADIHDVMDTIRRTQDRCDGGVSLTKDVKILEQWEEVVETISRAATTAKNALMQNPDPHAPGIDWMHTSAAVVVCAAISCMWPRIDSDVTEMPGHLLRAPMGIHGNTGRLGIFVDDLSSFYPDSDTPFIVETQTSMGFSMSPGDLAKKCFETFNNKFI